MALFLRALMLPVVFPGEGWVVPGLNDSCYHARRALYSFVNFPALLVYDAYIAFPDGAPVPMPPLYDWLLGGVARLLGSSVSTFESVVVWSAPFFSVLTLLPLYVAGRRVGGATVGLWAAWLFALWPASSLVSSVGNLDTQSPVAFLAAAWLASSLAPAPAGARARTWAAIAHAGVIAAMMLTWSGSLLYVVLAEGARLLVYGVIWARPQRLRDQALAAAIAAALVTPWVAVAPVPLGGLFAGTTLSWLHVIVLVGLGLLSGALSWLESRRPARQLVGRVVRAVLVSSLITLPLLTVEAIRHELWVGGGFVAGADVWAGANPEQQPLFSAAPRSVQRPAIARFGLFALLVPLAPIFVALRLRDRATRETTTILLVWTTVLSVLAIRQVRFALDFAVPGAVVFAALLVGLRPLVDRRVGTRFGAVVVTLLGLALLWPALAGSQLPRIRWARALWQRSSAGETRALTPRQSQLRFGGMVRAATPETSGFLDASLRPEYGLLVPPSFGHSFLYSARRPLPANNFGPYLDRGKLDDAFGFYLAANADEAARHLDRLGVRYVVTAASQPGDRPEFARALHESDGVFDTDTDTDSDCRPCLRLVTEGPPHGRPHPSRFPAGVPDEPLIPYKLFERVAGALLEVDAAPGDDVRAQLVLETPTGRRLLYRARARADATGVASLRVAYPTTSDGPVRALGPYTIHAGGHRLSAEVPEDAVRTGTVVRARTNQTR